MSTAETSTQSSVSLTREGESILFPELPYDMHDRSARAVGDPSLVEAIEKATYAKVHAREGACAEAFGAKYQPMRKLAEAIKQHTLDHLDHYLERFIDNAEAAGTHVHYATDEAEATAIALSIAEREGAKTCVKSKSMVTEETHLLEKLSDAGVQTLETDLGEFILQIDHDAPSHIVTPMIHKDRKAVARAFQRELGVAYTEDPERLTMIAREHLREKYRQADLGISGGNFLVASSGSLVLCTNEGNATFCTAKPRVHIAFVGIEKLVPSFEHVSVLLKLLSRSSTGQPLTVYTDLITGPRRAHEHDGPEQVHVVLVDNGRTGILGDEQMHSTLRCIRCGACLNACPVYRKVSGHSYGAVYSGPIGALITPMFKGLGNYQDLPHASSLCGACFEACPVRIDIPRQLVELRNRINGAKLTGWAERLVFRAYAASLKGSGRYKLANAMQKPALRLLAGRDGFVRSLPGPVKGWTAVRDMPAPAARSFRQWWKREHESDTDRKPNGASTR
jgi:L-lactate dehydrogenase complex protein LldF